ncbi:MAG: hypothetical protein U5J96_10090 [Ignavibacteriaceae bacterium]|nr:hypothetical protein [Ignavibacteriaceae bacterium]
MKFSLSKITIIILLLFSSCSDRSLFTDPNDPGLGGNYTIISGEISGTLLKSKSPYYVTSNISVSAGNKLVVEPGTIIFFKAKTGLHISGGIRAIGNKELPIIFKGVRNEWNGIHSTNPTDSLIFTFCRIQDIYLPISSEYRYGGVEISNASIIIKNCYFYFNYAQYGGALSLLYCNSEITNNIFDRNESLDYGGAILSRIHRIKLLTTHFTEITA